MSEQDDNNLPEQFHEKPMGDDNPVTPPPQESEKSNEQTGNSLSQQFHETPVGETEPPTPTMEEREKNIEREVRRRTLRGLAIWGAAAIVAPYAIFKWIDSGKKSKGVQSPLRKILDLNGKIFKTFASGNHLVKTYPREMALLKPRLNGDEGMHSPLDADNYKIQVINFNKPPFELTMDDIKALPKHEITYDFKCVEGWDMITNWGGALFSDFVKRYKLATHSGNEFDTNQPDDIANYAGLETPDSRYYVGLDIESALHPQTILCYEMNDEPLPVEHGGPLRLITPTKYGIKNIKRIGKITFADESPRDYWFERGYDYFAGL